MWPMVGWPWPTVNCTYIWNCYGLHHIERQDWDVISLQQWLRLPWARGRGRGRVCGHSVSDMRYELHVRSPASSGLFPFSTQGWSSQTWQMLGTF